MTPAVAAVLRHLAGAADAGGPCPTNVWLAQQLGMTEFTAADHVAWLQAHGHIRVDKLSRCTRTVTILATGQTTRPTVFAPTNAGIARRKRLKPKLEAKPPAPPPLPVMPPSADGFMRPITKAMLMAGR